MIGSLGFSQSLPFTFSNPDELFLGNDCTTSLTTDPNDAANAVMQVVGGGFDYDNALKTLTPVNLSDDANNSIYFRIKPVSGTGSGKHLFKFEGGTDAGVPGQTEVAFTTTGTDWQEIEVNFGAGLGSYPKMVIFTDFVSTSIDTYLIDDIRLGQSTGATPGLPFTFSKPTELFTGDGCATSLTTDPNNAANAVMQVVGGGADYDNAQKDLTPVNLSDDASNTIFFRIKPMNGTGSGSHLFKFENGTGGPAQVELPFTTAGTDWQDIEVNFGAGLGSFTKMVIFTDFANPSSDTYLIDDIRVGASGGVTLTQMNLPVTFNDPAVDYGVIGFGGAEGSSIVEDPTNASNTVAKVVKAGNAELWAGTTVSAVAPRGFSANIPFTASDTKMNVRVWSPDAGIQVRLKVEDTNDNTHSAETEATVTVAAGWQTLEFNFANPATGTADLNLSYNYNLASIFFNFGVTGAIAGEKTYYFDDMMFGAALATKSFSAKNLKMYPNPAKNNLTIDGINSIDNIEVYNIIGQRVINLNPKSNSVTINVSGLQNGLYVVKTTVGGSVASSKFVKE